MLETYNGTIAFNSTARIKDTLPRDITDHTATFPTTFSDTNSRHRPAIRCSFRVGRICTLEQSICSPLATPFGLPHSRRNLLPSIPLVCSVRCDPNQVIPLLQTTLSLPRWVFCLPIRCSLRYFRHHAGLCRVEWLSNLPPPVVQPKLWTQQRVSCSTSSLLETCHSPRRVPFGACCG